MRLGILKQVSPLLVRLNGDTVNVPAEAMNDVTAGTIDTSEVLAVKVEHRVFAWLVP